MFLAQKSDGTCDQPEGPEQTRGCPSLQSEGLIKQGDWLLRDAYLSTNPPGPLKVLPVPLAGSGLAVLGPFLWFELCCSNLLMKPTYAN
jgi:hypothetical protein